MKPGIVSSAADFDGNESPLGLLQWTIRFCQRPETLPVFAAWARTIWPAMQYTDEEILEDLIRSHNNVTRVLRAIEAAHDAGRT